MCEVASCIKEVVCAEKKSIELFAGNGNAGRRPRCIYTREPVENIGRNMKDR